MTPTPELRAKLRRLIDERIPDGGTETDTRFPDAELDELLEEAANLDLAAAEGWRRKAAMLAREIGLVASTRAGDMQVDMADLESAQSFALRMAEEYERRGQRQQSARRSRVLAFQPPDVLGTGEAP